MKWRQKSSRPCLAQVAVIVTATPFEADSALSAEIKANEIANTIEDTLGEGFEVVEVLVKATVDGSDPREARGE